MEGKPRGKVRCQRRAQGLSSRVGCAALHVPEPKQERRPALGLIFRSRDHAVAPAIARSWERAGRVKGALAAKRTLDAPQALPENESPERPLR
jgi:hypothetical protein